jgi:hypothetical protein
MWYAGNVGVSDVSVMNLRNTTLARLPILAPGYDRTPRRAVIAPAGFSKTISVATDHRRRGVFAETYRWARALDSFHRRGVRATREELLHGAGRDRKP